MEVRVVRRVQPHFDGDTYDPAKDHKRLSSRLEAVKRVAVGTGWWTVPELAKQVGGSETGTSARLRDLRKDKFGGYCVECRRVEGGVWEYRVHDKEKNT
jgi:hypothetical protein